MTSDHHKHDKSKGDHFDLVDIVANVVKVRIEQDEKICKIFKVFDVKKVKECKARLFTSQIFKRKGLWVIRLTFKVTIIFVDSWGKLQSVGRLLFFSKEISFPKGCDLCHWLKPRLEVEDIHCEADPILSCDSDLGVALRFVLVVACLKKEEITVVTPKHPC